MYTLRHAGEEPLHPDMKEKREAPGLACAFEISKPIPNDTLLPIRPHLRILQLLWGPFSFEPPQEGQCGPPELELLSLQFLLLIVYKTQPCCLHSRMESSCKFAGVDNSTGDAVACIRRRAASPWQSRLCYLHNIPGC